MNYDLKAWLAAATLPVWATASLWYDSAKTATAVASAATSVASAWLEPDSDDDDATA
jgi:hypothetical protein